VIYFYGRHESFRDGHAADHGEPVFDRRQWLFEAMPEKRQKPDFIRVREVQNLLGNEHVSQVRRVECAAQKGYFHMRCIIEDCNKFRN
jgi:hypothetical protein